MNEVKRMADAQLPPKFFNKKATTEKAVKAIKDAGKKGADLILFSEAFISGYPDWVWLVANSQGGELNPLYKELVKNAISDGDEATSLICKVAKSAKINVALSANELNSETSSATILTRFCLSIKKEKLLVSIGS